MAKPSGHVYLCKNALVDRNYTHTIDFKSPDEQYAYWGSLVKYALDKVTYIRRSSQFIQVDKNLDELKDVNYLFFRAEENAKLYYCFVTNKEYVSDTVTKIHFETDVLQTYMFDYQVKQSYVQQEHCDRWDANHKPIYSRTDEGLNYGSEYTVESAFKIKGDYDIKWYLAVCKTHNELVSEGHNATEPTDVANVSNPYIFYLLPTANDKHLSVDFKSGETITGLTVGGLNDFMKLMSNSALGEFVQQIVKLPYLPFNFKYVETSEGLIDIKINDEENAGFYYSTLNGKNDLFNKTTFIRVRYIKNSFSFTQKLAEMGMFEGIESALPTDEQWDKVTTNPYTTERDKRFESKLLTHPYRYNLLTDWKGQPIVYKNEFLAGDKIKACYMQSMSFNSPARYWLEGYKKDPEGRNNSIVQLTPEEAPVINDAYYSYMLANKNQIQANQTNAIVNATSNAIQGIVGGAIFGGGVGGVMGGISSAVNGAINYQNMIRSENAKQQDLKNLPDTIINSNDCAFNILDKNEYVTLYRMKICCEFEELLADTFAMTGYTVKRVKVPNLKSRVRYNYIKTVGANIVGSFDQEDLSTIKAIFDNGVTFWHYNTVNFKPFDYSLENIETKLIKD